MKFTKNYVFSRILIFSAFLLVVLIVTLLYSPLPIIVSIRDAVLNTVPYVQPRVLLQLQQDQKLLSIGTPFSVAIIGKSNRVMNGIDLILQFDTKTLDLVDIQPGSYFANPIIMSRARKLSDGAYLFSVASVSKSRSTNVLAVAQFKSKTRSGQTSIVIDSRTLIALKGGKQATIEFGPKALYTIVDTPKTQ